MSVVKHFRYSLCSQNSLSLVSANARCTCRSSLGDKAFQVAALKLWNQLPSRIQDINNLDVFKSAI